MLVRPKINFTGALRAMSVSYTATLPVRERTVVLLTSLLDAERARRGTRTGRRALSTLAQAVLVLRWFLDGTRMTQLTVDNGIGKSTAYSALHEGIDVLAARAPKLESALLAAKMAGHDHISIGEVTFDMLAEAQQTVDHVVIIDRGRLVASGPLDQIIKGGRTLEDAYLELTGPAS